MKYYLATTGISEIWNFDGRLLLLGPWCLTSEENKKIVIGKDYILVPSPWKPSFRIKEAADYCHNVYEESLPRLAEGLNYIHRVSYPVRYWRILIGPWLLQFIGVFFERYKRIENAKERYLDFYTYTLPLKQCCPISYDTNEFLNLQVGDDFYNLQLFSLVANELCPEHLIEKDYNPKVDRNTNMLSINWKDKLYTWKHKLFNTFLMSTELLFGPPVILNNMYHLKPTDSLLLKLKTGFNTLGFMEYRHLSDDFSKKCYSIEFRNLLNLKEALDRFQSLLYKILPYAIPICYLEKYTVYRDNIKFNRKIDFVKVAGSAVGWYFDERFKYFAAEAVSKGAKLVDFQYGGNYGFSAVVPLERLSLEKDKFFTWGWKLNNNNKIKPLPNPHLSKLKDTYSARIDNLLFVSTSIPRYHYRFHTLLLPEDIPKYFEDKKRFFQVLKDEIRNKLLYRLYFREYGWGEKELVKEVCPNVDSIFKGSLIKWMQKVKLVVIDHPHTSFLEALTINVPCIFYWDHDVYLMRPEAEEYFELLRRMGILYKDPESAAKKVNEIFSEPMKWWLTNDVQQARQKFCSQYAYSRRNWLKVWSKELKQLSNYEYTFN